MNSDAAPDKLPVLSLLGGGVQQPREPREGTDTVRPSSKTTVNASSAQETSVATASVLSAEIGIPFLQKYTLVLQDEVLNHSQFLLRKPRFDASVTGSSQNFA